MIDAAAEAVSWAQSELVIPGSQSFGFQRLSQRTDEVVLVFPGMGDEDVELDALGVSVRGHGGSVRQVRDRSWSANLECAVDVSGRRGRDRVGAETLDFRVLGFLPGFVHGRGSRDHGDDGEDEDEENATSTPTHPGRQGS
jgi:hypothetical protein